MSSRQANSARHDEACTHAAWQATRLHHRRRQGPTRSARLSTPPPSRWGNAAQHVRPARNSHAQPTRLTTAANANSSSQTSKSRKYPQEMHKSAMCPPALAGRPMHRLMIRDKSQGTRYTARAFDEFDHMLRHASAHKREHKPLSPSCARVSPVLGFQNYRSACTAD